MKVQATILSLCSCLIVGGLTAAIYGQSTSTEATKKMTQATTQAMHGTQDEYVGVYISSVTRQIKMSDLAKAYPANRAGIVDKSQLAADAIVGWYDRGNNYHEQKMQNNLRPDMGGLRVLPQMLRGQAIRGAEAGVAK